MLLRNRCACLFRDARGLFENLNPTMKLSELIKTKMTNRIAKPGQHIIDLHEEDTFLIFN